MLYKKAKPLKKPDDVEHAYGYALFLLERKFRSEREMKEKMNGRGYYADVIDTVMSKLKRERLIDDDRFTENLIDSLKNYRDYGFFMIQRKLIERLVPKELITEKLAEMVTPEEELELARKYVKKHYGGIASVKKMEYADKQKIMRRMAGRGFRLSALSFIK